MRALPAIAASIPITNRETTLRFGFQREEGDATERAGRVGVSRTSAAVPRLKTGEYEPKGNSMRSEDGCGISW
jgi:hypothetical protein